MNAPPLILIATLKAQRLVARLDWNIQIAHEKIIFLTDYFDAEIKVFISVLQLNNNLQFSCTFHIDGYGDTEFPPIKHSLKRTAKLTSNIADAINMYLRSRPFAIQQLGKGKYRLLDPNGYDYIGEFVTLRDARRTACGNWIA